MPSRVRQSIGNMDPMLEKILTRVRLRASRRAAWLNMLWSEEIGRSCEYEERGCQYHIRPAEIATYLADADSPATESEWFKSEKALEALNKELENTERQIASYRNPRYARLCRTFYLNPVESDFLQTCLSVSIDPILSRIYGYLQDHAAHNYVSEYLVARLFGYGRCLSLSKESPLFRWELLTVKDVGPAEPTLYACDPWVRNWLLGEDQVDETLSDISNIRDFTISLKSWPVEEAVGIVKNALKNDTPNPLIVQVYGIAGSGRRTFAAVVCKRIRRKLLTINTDLIEPPNFLRTYIRAHRMAHLNGMIPAWYGDNFNELVWPAGKDIFPVQFLISEAGKDIPQLNGMVEYKIEMPEPTVRERTHLIKKIIPNSARWAKELASRGGIGIGDISHAAALNVRNADQALSAIYRRTSDSLGGLVQQVDTPFTWDDIVLPDHLRNALDDFVFEARERIPFWESPQNKRLFPQGQGLVGMLVGPPGVGKTMTAQCIAGPDGLNMPLLRCNLAQIQSKWVSEFMKNVEKVMNVWKTRPFVLLFDEADAIFSKRTDVISDAHDILINADINYLIQALENYSGPGPLLLSTNKPTNIDPAFIRRIRYVLSYDKPDIKAKYEIFRNIIVEMAGYEQFKILKDHIIYLSENLDVTGSQIKFGVLSAMYFARKERISLCIEHLMKGLDRELMKEGRLLSIRESKRLVSFG